MIIRLTQSPWGIWPHHFVVLGLNATFQNLFKKFFLFNYYSFNSVILIDILIVFMSDNAAFNI